MEPDIAAFIGESISANPIVPSEGYWKGVRDLCKRNGILLIFDEIIEGFGRTGKMFASEHYLTPDILVLGKSLGGGILPLAGIVTREKYNICQNRSIGHYTHEKNALSAAAALAEIDVIEKNNLCDHASRLGTHALERLRDMAERHPLIGDVRGLGLLLGIELVRDRKTRERATDEAEAVMYAALTRGLSFKLPMGNILTLTPALTITREEMGGALDIIDTCLSEIE